MILVTWHFHKYDPDISMVGEKLEAFQRKHQGELHVLGLPGCLHVRPLFVRLLTRIPMSKKDVKTEEGENVKAILAEVEQLEGEGKEPRLILDVHTVESDEAYRYYPKPSKPLLLFLYSKRTLRGIRVVVRAVCKKPGKKTTPGLIGLETFSSTLPKAEVKGINERLGLLGDWGNKYIAVEVRLPLYPFSHAEIAKEECFSTLLDLLPQLSRKLNKIG